MVTILTKLMKIQAPPDIVEEIYLNSVFPNSLRFISFQVCLITIMATIIKIKATNPTKDAAQLRDLPGIKSFLEIRSWTFLEMDSLLEKTEFDFFSNYSET